VPYRPIVLILLFTLAVFFSACGGDESPPGKTPTTDARLTTVVSYAPAGIATFDVLAGLADGVVDVETFMPATVRVREGDTITWTGSGHEGHTVTFLPDGKLNIGTNEYLIPAPDMPGAREFNPAYALASEAQGEYDGTQYTNSGFFGVPAPQEYSLSFPKAGVYPYLCMIHPLTMRGTVVVDAPDAQVPSPEAVAVEAERAVQAYTTEAKAAVEAAVTQRRAASEVAAGQAWEVSVGIDTPHAQVVAFVPSNLEIDTGDRVIFWNSDRDFHNVIFAPEGTTPPQFPILKPVEGRGGFRLLINPDAEREIPPPEGFGPEALFSSGIMGITFPRFYYEVTFEKPGTYNFYCTVHTLAGMAGQIVVR
jgi:plastocyanin